jgi:hypothetical protein
MDNPHLLKAIDGHQPNAEFSKWSWENGNAHVHFLPVNNLGHNYLKHCTRKLDEKEKPRRIDACVRQYTEAKSLNNVEPNGKPLWYCTEMNMALATDSNTLCTHGAYIRQLKYCIHQSKGFTGTVIRGKPTCFRFKLHIVSCRSGYVRRRM